MGRLCVVVLALFAACGRVGFDPVGADATAPDSLGGVPCLADPCPTGSMFCSNFETEQPPMFAPWDAVELETFSHQPAGPGTELAIADAPACNQHSLDAHVVGDQQFVQLFEELVPRPPTIYVRSMVYVPSTNPQQSIDTLGVGDLDTHFLLLGLRSTGYLDVNSSEPIDGPVTSGPAFALDEWTCMEIAVTFGSPAGHVTVWIGTEIQIDVDGATESSPGVLTHAIVGASTNVLGEHHVYFDDFAASASRIGCT